MANMRDYIKSLTEDKSYDWICNHGWELTKDDLISIIKEFDYAIGSMKPYDSKEDVYESIAEELTDRCLYDEE